MDYKNLEELCIQGARMIIISNPHNPVGRVWTKDELTKLGNICLKHNVLVISDEIHSDLIITPNKHIPFASISQEFAANSITFASASKTFNLAGLFLGHVIIPNADILKKYNQMLESTGAGQGNIFGFEAVKSAYSEKGAIWLDELVEYIKGNALLVKDFISKNLPKIKVAELQGTYLLWLDFRSLGLSNEEVNNILINNAGLGLNKGEVFGDQGKCFQRMNLACPRSIVEEALKRMYNSLKEF